MPDIIDTLRAADPEAGTAARTELDARARAGLRALLADGDDLSAGRRQGSRRWALPGAAAAAVVVLLTGTFGASQIAALRGTDPAGQHALLDPGGGTSTGADAEAASRARIQAVRDAFRAATAKATPLYLLGAPSGLAAIEPQLRLEERHDAKVAESVRAGALLGVPIEPGWAASWDAFRARVVLDFPSPSAAPVAPTPHPTQVRVTVPTVTGTVEVDGFDLEVGQAGSGVHLLIPSVPPASYVDLPRRETGARPVFVTRPDATGTVLRPVVIEDENATRGEYALDVREENDVVVLSVRTIRDSRPTSMASPGLMRRTRTVDLPEVALTAPLGTRPLLDAATGTWVQAAG